MTPDARPTKPRIRCRRSPVTIASTRPKTDRPRSAHHAGPKERRSPGMKYLRQSVVLNRKCATRRRWSRQLGAGQRERTKLQVERRDGISDGYEVSPVPEATGEEQHDQPYVPSSGFASREPQRTRRQRSRPLTGPMKVHFVPMARPAEAAAMTQAARRDLSLKTWELMSRATADRINASPTTSS